jgi:hypothetical protein
MSRGQALLAWLDDRSDRLSPIVVKEIRQAVRGREFVYSFVASLLAGLTIAFFGAADAVTGASNAGSWTFGALITCLALLGLGVVPIGAFTGLRNERLEQTLELITLTALTPRRVVIGKLLAQAVKLATLFAAIAPFIAMSFLLGGIDFVTILVSLAVLFAWSLWACAGCLFLSTLLKTRAMTGIVFGGMGIVMFMVLGAGRSVYYVTRGGFFGMGSAGVGGAGSAFWWAIAIAISACAITMVNFVLLAENRLSLPTEDKVTTLRAGFLAQFLLIVAWALSFLLSAPRVQRDVLEVLGVLGGWHLAVVAMFTLTEDLVVSRRVRQQILSPSGWRGLLVPLRPGGGRGALYVLVQMGLLLGAARLFDPTWLQFRWFVAICAYICFFTGVPVAVFRILLPSRPAAFPLRIVVLTLVPLALVLPDVVHYVLWQPEVLDIRFSVRHLFNPIRTIANWHLVEANGWVAVPMALGAIGLVAYLRVILTGHRMTVDPEPDDPAPLVVTAGEPGSAGAVN